MSVRIQQLQALCAVAALCGGVTLAGCGDLGGEALDTDGDAASGESANSGTTNDSSDNSDTEPDDDDGTGSEAPTYPDAQDGIEMSYRSIDDHPGCSTAGLAYTPANIPGYSCAAKEYGTDDGEKPIILLIHGNSDSPDGWESFDPQGACDETLGAEGTPMMAEVLSDAGFKVLAIDMRFDLVDDPDTDNDTENAAKNMDHGWGVPLVEHFVQSTMEAFPDRRFAIMGFSFGVTAGRDALRRLLVNEGFDAFAQLDHAFWMAGANHGVSSFPLCGVNPTMRGTVTCEMGDRAAYSPTYFTAPLNGPSGEFETPCGDGEMAFGESVCDNTVEYTTVVMEDLPGGEQQDLFVSEASAALSGADNRTVGLNDFDATNYFFCGLFRNHYGAIRNEVALGIVADKLGFSL